MFLKRREKDELLSSSPKKSNTSSSSSSSSSFFLPFSCRVFAVDDLICLVLQCLALKELISIRCVSSLFNRLSCTKKEAWAPALQCLYFKHSADLLTCGRLTLIKGLKIHLDVQSKQKFQRNVTEPVFARLARDYSQHLERLDIEQVEPIRPAHYRYIAQLKHLRVLNISDHSINFDSEVLAAVSQLIDLEILRLPRLSSLIRPTYVWQTADTSQIMKPQDFHSLKRLSKLRFIHIAHYLYSFDDPYTCAQTSELMTAMLQSISHVPQVSLDAFPLNIPFQTFENLKSLSLLVALGLGKAEPFGALTLLKNVTRLFIHLSLQHFEQSCLRGDKFVAHLFAAMRSMNWLEELYIENLNRGKHADTCECFKTFENNNVGLFAKHNKLAIFQLINFSQLPPCLFNFNENEAPRLRSVALHNCQLKPSLSYEPVLSLLSSDLSHLDLFATGLTLECLRHVLPRFSKLVHLNIGGNQSSFVSKESHLLLSNRVIGLMNMNDPAYAKNIVDWSALLSLACLPSSLRVLNISQSNCINDALVQQAVGSFPLLEELDLSNTLFADVEILEPLARLKSVNLYACQITQPNGRLKWKISKTHSIKEPYEWNMFNNRFYHNLSFDFIPWQT